VIVLNTDVDVLVPTIRLTAAEVPWLDDAWLADRVLRRAAVIAGRFVGVPGEGGIRRFEVSQAFVPLPDRAGPCPRIRMRGCAPGMEESLTRDADRCQIADACVRDRACRELPPTCAPGYLLRSWRAHQACRTYACDPAFLPQ